MARRDLFMMALCGLFVACSVPPHVPYPLDFADKLPKDAFARCREVLLTRYGTLQQSNREAFQLRTGWMPVSDPPGERRATVYQDPSRDDSLSVVVELRRLTIPLFRPPQWSSPSGDDAAERELGNWLREALRDPDGSVRMELKPGAKPDSGSKD